MNLGVVIILIVILGYASNWLNWRYLNYPAVRLLFYVGAFVHELSHILLCYLTGAAIQGGSIFSRTPHINHSKPRLPVFGQLLISLAPIAGGLVFLFLINRYCLAGYFRIPQFSSLQDIFVSPLIILSQINLFEWQSWLMIFLFINIGSMIGPSFQDLKNMWFLLIVLLFINIPPLANLGFLAVILILTNILIQLIFIVLIKIAQIIFATKVFMKN